MSSARILAHAIKDSGLTETRGPDSHPRILHAIRVAALWLDPDDSQTAWCGCIRGLWGLETGTGVPKAHYRAKSWASWGKPVALKDALPGDTVILSRRGGHHVALFQSADRTHLRLFGGNQSNACNSSRFPIETLLAIRRGA